MKTQNYHETELGKVPDSVKNVELSERTKSILSGANDNDPIDPEIQPVLARINAKINKKTNTIKTLSYYKTRYRKAKTGETKAKVINGAMNLSHEDQQKFISWQVQQMNKG